MKVVAYIAFFTLLNVVYGKTKINVHELKCLGKSKSGSKCTTTTIEL